MSETLHDKLSACRSGWAVDRADGPASRWPILVPRPAIAEFCLDRRGFGVPAESLPMSLSPYSVCGWKLAVRSGAVVLEAGCSDPVNEQGCRRHLKRFMASASKAYMAWASLQRVLAELASSAGSASAEPSRQEQGAKAPQRRPWSPKVAKRRPSARQSQPAASGGGG